MGAWSIIEEGRDEYGHMGFREEAEMEAYKRGCRHGYEKAMREIHGDMGRRATYGERDYDDYGGMSERRRYGRMGEPPYSSWRDDDMMGERRRRDSRGRYM